MNSTRIAINTMFKTLISRQERLEEKMGLILEMLGYNNNKNKTAISNDCRFVIGKGKRKGEECKRKCGIYKFCTKHRDIHDGKSVENDNSGSDMGHGKSMENVKSDSDSGSESDIHDGKSMENDNSESDTGSDIHDGKSMENDMADLEEFVKNRKSNQNHWTSFGFEHTIEK